MISLKLNAIISIIPMGQSESKDEIFARKKVETMYRSDILWPVFVSCRCRCVLIDTPSADAILARDISSPVIVAVSGYGLSMMIRLSAGYLYVPAGDKKVICCWRLDLNGKLIEFAYVSVDELVSLVLHGQVVTSDSCAKLAMK